MKKITILFVLVLVIISGCSVKQEVVTKYNPGDVVSSDIIDFKLYGALFTHYADARFDAKVFALPTDREEDAFTADEGHILVIMSFAIKNNGRDSIRIGNDSESTYNLQFKINYGGKEYRVNGRESNVATGLSMKWSVINKKDEVRRICISDSSVLVDPDEVLYVRMIGIVSFEPRRTSDSFELVINVANSSGDYDKFTYTIPSSESKNNDF